MEQFARKDTPVATPGSEAATNQLSDELIIERVRQGRTADYAFIMRRYNQRLFRTARSILIDDDAAQDAVQEAYIAAYFKLDTYQSRGKLGAWLSRITVNEALILKRKVHHKRVDNMEMNETTTPMSAYTNPADALANRQLVVLIENAIDKLPEMFRIVFVLRAVQQLSVRETADTLGIEEATVKTRFLRARQKMMVMLDGHIHEAGLQAFDFAGRRCDRMVEEVLARLGVCQ